MNEKKFNIAILINNNNTQAKLLKETIQEVSKYGKATIRRIYGDWTTQTMNSWKNLINQYSINPIQKFSYTSGKNSTDGALIIDAMDILHSKSVQGFCIVSSDSDYTGLAKRIREEGMFVMGIGESKIPESFVKSCDIFTYTENITPKESAPKKKTKSAVSNETDDKKTKTKVKNTSFLSEKDYETVSRAFEISTDENEVAYVSTIGLNIRKIDPSFDTRAYYISTLSKLFEKLNEFKVIKNQVGALNHPLVKRK